MVEEQKRRRVEMWAKEHQGQQSPDIVAALLRMAEATLVRQKAEATQKRDDDDQRQRDEQKRVRSDERRALEFCMAKYYRFGAVEPLLRLDYAADSKSSNDSDSDELVDSQGLAVKAQRMIDFYTNGSEVELIKLFDFTPFSFQRHAQKCYKKVDQYRKQEKRKLELYLR